MYTHTIAIDLAKTVFHLVGLNTHGDVVVQRMYSRSQCFALPRTFVLPDRHRSMRGRIFPGRALRDQGHDVRLMPARYAKP